MADLGIQMKVNSKVIVTVTNARNSAELFQNVASLAETFSDERCGCCSKSNFKYVHRTNDEGHDFHELHCQQAGCRARLYMGHKKKDDSLYPKRRWDQLSDKGKNPEVKQREHQKEYAEEHSGYLPNDGWVVYRSKDK